MKNLMMAGSIAFIFAGCASNGGGYVVGNSAIPANTAQKVAQADTAACGHKNGDGTDHKNCAKCADKKAKDHSCSKDGAEACSCGH